MKAYVKYLKNRLLGRINRDYQSVAGQIDLLQYLPESRSFEITKEDMKMSDRVVIRREIITRLREYYPSYKIRLSQLKLEYYDKCLHRYLDEMLRRSFTSAEACWFRLTQTHRCIYQLEDGETLDTEEGKSAFLSKLKYGEELKTGKGDWHRSRTIWISRLNETSHFYSLWKTVYR